jgi:hypothetical protein
MNLTERAISLLGAAIAMHACVLGWNAASHRKADRVSWALGALFWLLAAIVICQAIRLAI